MGSAGNLWERFEISTKALRWQLFKFNWSRHVTLIYLTSICAITTRWKLLNLFLRMFPIRCGGLYRASLRAAERTFSCAFREIWSAARFPAGAKLQGWCRFWPNSSQNEREWKWTHHAAKVEEKKRLGWEHLKENLTKREHHRGNYCPMWLSAAIPFEAIMELKYEYESSPKVTLTLRRRR